MINQLAKSNMTLALSAHHLARQAFLLKLLNMIGLFRRKLISRQQPDKTGFYWATTLDKHRLSAAQTEYDLYSCRFVR
jgi:hypothetical protein